MTGSPIRTLRRESPVAARAGAYQAAGGPGWAIPLFERAERLRVLGADYTRTKIVHGKPRRAEIERRSR